MIQPEPGDWSSYFQRFLEGKRMSIKIMKFTLRFPRHSLIVLSCSCVWILVRSREQLVEEEADLFETPLHVLRRSDWGDLLVSASCLCLLFVLQPVTLFLHLTNVFPGHRTRDRQTQLLSWFVSISRGEEGDSRPSAVWYHEKERHVQPLSRSIFGFQNLLLHEKR